MRGQGADYFYSILYYMWLSRWWNESYDSVYRTLEESRVQKQKDLAITWFYKRLVFYKYTTSNTSDVYRTVNYLNYV